MQLLNAGCGTWYAEGWTNTDVWQNEETRPDVLVKLNEPYPFGDGIFDAIYLGHVLEHLDWRTVVDFLRDMKRIAKPGAPILMIGPDARRALKLWKEDQLPEDLLLSILEHQEVVSDYQAKWWDGAVHCWNCHQDRVQHAALTAGLVNPRDVSSKVTQFGTEWHEDQSGITWPVVGFANWQFALRFDAPSK